MLTVLTDKAPACADNAGTACAIAWKLTGSAWLAESSDTLIVKPMRILLIIAICLLARGLINRTIKRITDTRAGRKMPTILRPFKERLPNLMSDVDAVDLLGDRRRQRAQTIGSVLRSLVTWLVYAVMAMLVLAELNISLGPLLASAGIAGLAIGFGAQALVKDILSGMFMIMEDQYGVGDVVDLGETIGTIEMVGLRVTTVRDLQGTLWYVRNGEIIRVGNFSQSWAKVVLLIPLAPSVDVDAAADAIIAAAGDLADDPEWSHAILDRPEPQGLVDMTLDGSVYRLLLKTSSAEQWAVARELRRRVARALRQAGIAEELTGSRVYVRRDATRSEQK